MRFEWLVAQRYLRSPYKPAVLRLVTLLSVVGVTAGVTTLVVALAVNSGFRHTIQDRLLGVAAHVNLTQPGSEGIRDYAVLTERLENTPGVLHAAPAIYQTVLLGAAGRARGIVLKGIDPAREQQMNEILRRIVDSTAAPRQSRVASHDSPAAGRLPADFSLDQDGIEAILLGRALAEELGLKAGEYVTLTGARGRLTPFGMVPRSRRYRVTGIFDSGFFDYDAGWGFVTLEAAQTLAGTGDVVNVIEFRIAELERAGDTAAEVLSRAGAGFTVRTWMEQHRALFRALQLEKLVSAIFIGLIMFVAGLNILVVLAMTVTEKARDVAVLMAMGARRAQVRTIFVLQGLLVGLVGTAVGLALGYSLAWAGETYRLIPLDPEVYAVSYVPFDPQARDAVWISLAALAISAAATLVPARAAARIFPVEILRYE